MKRFVPFFLAGVIGYYSGEAQHADTQLAVNSVPDRINILKASLTLMESEEKMFWPLYEQYELQLSNLKENTLRAMKHLVSQEEGSVHQRSLSTFFENQKAETAIKKQYFNKILTFTNATIALEFLQGEALYDLLLKSRLYESSGWKNIWSNAMLTDEALRRTTFESLLKINPSMSDEFTTLFSNFEFEYSRVVGHEYLFFQHYIDDPVDWTPRQCKMLGENFLAMQFNEMKIKDRYYTLLSEKFDKVIASRFISLHEYMSMMSKMEVWTEKVND